MREFLHDHWIGVGITFALIITFMIIIFAPCIIGNKQMFDTQNKFNRAIVYSPSGDVVEAGEIEWWNDYEGEQLQVKFKNSGNIYLTSSMRCDLIKVGK